MIDEDSFSMSWHRSAPLLICEGHRNLGSGKAAELYYIHALK
jgi:hypothetical protein